MEQIKISIPEIAKQASELRTIENKLDDTLTYVSKQMNELNSVWFSEGEIMLLEDYQRQLTKYLSFIEVLDSYIKYLERIVSCYTALNAEYMENI